MRASPAPTFQDLILRLQAFWAEYGCVIGQPFDSEKGAGTYNPHTFLRALGPEPWKVAFVEPSRRPTDGRYGDNPNRLYRHHQFQVILKPSPEDVQGLYLRSMRAIGIHPEEHDIRFVEDNWESPTLGAWGLGWEVWVDGMELTQFTYFQQCGGLECRPVSAELTYGLERIAMYLQRVDNVYDLAYAPGVSYREVFREDEVQYSKFHFEGLDVRMYFTLFEAFERECARLVEAGLVIPAYDHCLKAAHAFNSLDARGAISVTERQGYILRIRELAKKCAEGYQARREELGFPLGNAALPPEVALMVERPAAEPAPEAPGGPRELFLEVGSEEIPAGEVDAAVAALAQGVTSRLAALRLSHGPARTYATPRRLVVVVPDVADRQEDVTREVAGPPVRSAFKDGQPTKAAEGFAKGQGVSVQDLVRRDTPKGEYLYAIVAEKGKATAGLLPALLTEAITGITFKRAMRWGALDATFSRPVVWITALFGGQTVPVTFAGVRAGNQSRGHRFLAPEAFTVTGEASWLRELEHRHVVPDVARRRALIIEGAERIAREAGGRIERDEALLDEITQLVETPVPLLGHFDARFLDIPKEVLTSEMKHHQRYLPVVKDTGALLPSFVVVANTTVEDPAVSLDGYRRVLTARFEDGAFFFKEDLKAPLYSRVDRLKSVTFHRALGSIYEKVERTVKLAFYLGGALAGQLGGTGAPRMGGAGAGLVAPADLRALADGPPPAGDEPRWAWTLARAGYLMKADLSAQMVFEFPELQGVIGAEYAARNGEPTEVSMAIADHYRPRTADDELPHGVFGALLGMADRLDSIAGIFSTGKGPTGSADPFGLRRATLAIINLLRARGWHLSLEGAVREAVSLIGARRTKDENEVLGEIREFFRTRLRGVLTDDGVPADVAEAVLSAGYDDLVDAGARGLALAGLRRSKELEPVAITFKRVANILRPLTEPVGAVDGASLGHEAERRLHAGALAVAEKVKVASAGRDFGAAISTIAELRPLVDALFEAVMVNDPDPATRARRLALVKETHEIFAPLADFTKLS